MSAEIRFLWQPVPGATLYRVSVQDRAQRLLWEGETKGEALDAPRELLRELKRGGPLYWTVTAFGNGVARTSDLVRFELK